MNPVAQASNISRARRASWTMRRRGSQFVGGPGLATACPSPRSGHRSPARKRSGGASLQNMAEVCDLRPPGAVARPPHELTAAPTGMVAPAPLSSDLTFEEQDSPNIGIRYVCLHRPNVPVTERAVVAARASSWWHLDWSIVTGVGLIWAFRCRDSVEHNNPYQVTDLSDSHCAGVPLRRDVSRCDRTRKKWSQPTRKNYRSKPHATKPRGNQHQHFQDQTAKHDKPDDDSNSQF